MGNNIIENKNLIFEIEHYGQLIQKCDYNISKGYLTMKTYLYDGKKYNEVWWNGELIKIY